MAGPFPGNSKQATTDVVVELSRSEPPPCIPAELQGVISPETWEARVRTIVAVMSQYSRPTFERIYLLFAILITLLVPVVAYYFSLRALEQTGNDLDASVWYARFITFGVTIATWFVMFLPITLWKYLGKVRINKVLAQWSKDDLGTAPYHAANPVWKLTPPGLFRDSMILVVTVPVMPRVSNFHLDADLPPYIGPANESLLPYEYRKMNCWSKDLDGGIHYGNVPIYSDGKNII